MERLRELKNSIYYYIKDVLHDYGCNTIREGDQDELFRIEVPYFVYVNIDYDDIEIVETVLPSVVLFHDTGSSRPMQIGGGKYDAENFELDIYAKTNVERDDLLWKIFQALDDGSDYLYDFTNGSPYYTYASGEGLLIEYYPSGMPTAISPLYFEGVGKETLPRLSEVGEIDNHRAVITFTALTLR